MVSDPPWKHLHRKGPGEAFQTAAFWPELDAANFTATHIECTADLSLPRAYIVNPSSGSAPGNNRGTLGEHDA